MRNGAGMWGLRLVLLASLVVLAAGSALFPSAGPEVWSEQRALATLLPGTSGPGRGELANGLPFARRWGASPVGTVVQASARLVDLGVTVIRTGDGIVKGVKQAAGRGAALTWWAEALGGPGDGVIVPLFDLLAISVMVVTFGVLLGSWARKGH